MSGIIAVDFETLYDEKAGFGIKQQGMDAYVNDPRFDPYLISVSDGSETWAGQPKDFNWDALDGRPLCSHNARFDSKVYSRMVELGKAPQIKIPEWHCTANLTSFLCMRRDLARACEFLLGVRVDKGVRGAANGKGWAELTAEDGGKSMLEYARKDALLCWTIWTKYSPLWPTLERKLSALTIKQGRRGCNIDVGNLTRQIHTSQRALIQAESVLPWMAAGRAPTSPKAVAEECRKHGIPAPPVKSKDGDEAYDEWAATYAPKHRWVKAYTDYRVINKYLGALTTVKERLMEDGRFPYDLLYFGAHTGRWSGGGGFNMQNLRKEPLIFDLDGWLVTDEVLLKEFAKAAKTDTVPSWVSEILDIRSLFIASAGMDMYAPDLSQIEPRVLAWTVKDQPMLDKMAAGESPYSAHAIATMGWKGGDLKSQDKPLYALAKARVLGLGYGCGWKKFISVAMTMAQLDITKDDPEWVQATNSEGEPCLDKSGQPILISGWGMNSRRIVKEYREQNPLITGLWKMLDDQLKASIGGTLTITLPSGRTLRYPEVQRERKVVMDPDDPKKWAHKWVITALAFDKKRNSVVRKPFYGGLLAENVIQAISRDVFGEHVIALDETEGVNVLWTVHDEAPLELDRSQFGDHTYVDGEGRTRNRRLESIMARTPDWIEGCPVAAEAVLIPHYKK